MARENFVGRMEQKLNRIRPNTEEPPELRRKSASSILRDEPERKKKK